MEASPLPRSGHGVPAAGIALLAIGSIGPWVTITGETGYGLGRDGVITIIFAAIAAIFLVVALARSRPPSRIALGLCALLALAVAIYDIIDVSGTQIGPFDATVGWGLWLAAVGALVLAAGVTVARR